MIAYCSDSGISREDIETALQALSFSKAEEVPVLAARAAGAGQPGRVVFASEPMLALFRAADLDAISARLFETRDPGARRLVELSRSLPTESGPRLERLRFFFGPVVETVTFLCRKYVIGHEGPLLIAAALGAKPIRKTVASAAPLVSIAAEAEPRKQADAAAVPAAALPLEEIKNALAARLADRKSVRFLWRTDAEDKITEITPPLAEVVGAAAADLLGRDFGDVAKYLERDPNGPLGRAFVKRETFSGIEVLWPIAGAAAAVPVSLGALPAFTPERRFDGYRGFGVIRLDRLTAAEPRDFMVGPVPPAAEPSAHQVADNVVHLRPFGTVAKAASGEAPEKPSLLDRQGQKVGPLTHEEQTAFHEIAAALADETAAAAEAAKIEPQHIAPPGVAPVAEPISAAAPLQDETSIAASLGRNAAMILDRLGFGILISRDDVPIYANRYLLDLLGYADEDAFHAAGGMARIFEQAPAPGSEAIDLRTASGKIAAVRGRLQTIDWEGLPATLLTLRQDEEKELRGRLEADVRSLKIEAGELTAILDTATDGLALIDAQGRILALNRSGEALFGYDQRDVVGQPFTFLIAPESQTKARDYFAGLQSDGVASLLNDGREIIGQARQGGAIPIFLTLGRIGAGRGEHQEQKYCALLRDMTHWKKIEQELDAARREAERASALKSDFLAKISHEIRTPLNAILGFAEVIMEERFGPMGNERYRDYLKDIHTSGAHVMSLVNDLLDLSKIEAGRMDLDFVAVDPSRVISECVAIMQPQANRERVIMRLALAPNLPKIMADERSLRQIILNILSNAVKFNEPGGQVIIATALTDTGEAVIRIRDTGIGMSEDDIETALEPFRQLATSRQSAGTGLGLPLTKALVEANRAFFSIKSKKNEGTLVEVAFPPARLLSRDPLSA
ncbi:MAG: PAS domain-containing sensor histidine kinase [Methylovirgula sp.]